MPSIPPPGLEMGFLFHLSESLHQGQTINEKAFNLIENLKKNTGAGYASLALLEGDELKFISGAGRNIDDLEGFRAVRSPDPLWRAIHSGTIQVKTSGQTTGPFSPGSFFALLAGDLPAYAVIPLVTPASTIGVLLLGFENPAIPLGQMTELFNAVSNIAGNAFYQVLSTQALEKLAADRSRELRTIYKITSIVNQPLDLSEAFRQALTEILAATGFSMGGIFLANENEGTVSLVANANFPPALQSYLTSQPLDSSLEGRVIKSGSPVETRITGEMFTEPLDGLVLPVLHHGLPIISKGQAIGSLCLLGIPDRELSPDQVALLNSIGDHLGMIIENHQLRINAERAAVVEERARLAREFHDSVVQSLYSATLLNAAARELLKANKTDELEANLERLETITKSTLKEMRLLVYELRSPALDEGGIVEAIRRRLSAVEMMAGIEASLDVQDYRSMELREEEELYRIAIEGLNNSLKYSNAAKISVTLKIVDRNIFLTIEDDGIGFDPEEIRLRGGSGIKTLRDRCAKLSGRLEIDSIPGQGTRLTACIPGREIDKISSYKPRSME